MKVLSRFIRRTPSLRTRVVVATAIGAAIPVLIVGTVVWVGITNDRQERLHPRAHEGGGFPVLIVGTVVWVGITNDRQERLDRRLDEAAGFAIPFLPRGLDEIPKSPN